jgi:hypothetical protein
MLMIDFDGRLGLGSNQYGLRIGPVLFFYAPSGVVYRAMKAYTQQNRVQAQRLAELAGREEVRS